VTKQIETHRLPAVSPGTQRFLRLHRYGAGLPRRAYVQASLHANETPAQLAAVHLLSRLDAADAAGQIRGEVVVVPAANPIGLDQHGRMGLQGRYHQRSGLNFNRAWPDLVALIQEGLSLGADPHANVATIRAAMHEAVSALPAVTDDQALRRQLTLEACAAELVIDLHCDDVALPYVYVSPRCWPALADLAGDLGARAVLTALDSGGRSFDEAFSLPWATLAEAFPGCPVPQATDALTVELRGAHDVSDNLAAADADAVFRALARRGFVDADVPPPRPLRCDATPLEASTTLKAHAPGLVVYAVPLGAQVAAGDLVAEVIDPTAADPHGARVAHHAAHAGMVLSRRGHRAVVPGQALARIVGTEPVQAKPSLDD